MLKRKALIVNGNSLGQNGHFLSLREALRSAQDGDTIHVFPFNYQERTALEVSKTVMIEGMRPWADNSIKFHAGGLVLNALGGGTLRNLAISAESTATQVVRVTQGTWSLKDCSILSKGVQGAVIDVADSAGICSVALTDCSINGQGVVGVRITTSTALSSSSSSFPPPAHEVTNISIRRCSISARVGICRETDDTCTTSVKIMKLDITDTTIDASGESGVKVMMHSPSDSARELVIFSKCKITSKGTGLVLRGKGLFRLAHCTVQSPAVPLLVIGQDLVGSCENGSLENDKVVLMDSPSVTFQSVKMEGPDVSTVVVVVTEKAVLRYHTVRDAFNAYNGEKLRQLLQATWTRTRPRSAVSDSNDNAWHDAVIYIQGGNKETITYRWDDISSVKEFKERIVTGAGCLKWNEISILNCPMMRFSFG
mmetsp:Transcript_12148/g.19617  ORF Transcript_12148/g.19617 Transcript_12148/m.19617 type:complete len:425 (+) Transcript_12148:846-2120(+)